MIKTLTRASDQKLEELYFVGEVIGAQGFRSSLGVNCHWHFEEGNTLAHLEGSLGGQTQTCISRNGRVAWNHPIDAHFAMKTMFSKAKVVVQVNFLDHDGRHRVAGYGHCFLPMASGTVDIAVQCWRPVSSVRDELAAYFLGNVSQLVNTDAIATQTAWTERSRLITVPTGTVYIRVAVLRKEVPLT